MGNINVLSFEIANLIAAGEVVERPSSVMKELIENSIDSGATEIIAEIKRGGVALIRVSDNGCGIEKEDLPVALKRHATSKIKEKDDLNSIMTLGFRGEALAAISSVSEVTIITKTKKADTAYMLTSEGGNIIDVSEVGAADGTTVVVENLFFNVPARRKFLKKDSTEAMNVAALVEKVAISRPDIAIKLLIDGEERFSTYGDGNLLNTLRCIFGKDFANKLIQVTGEADGVKVSGYVGRSDNVRKNRNLENIFINGRYVKSLTAQAAIEKAYTSFIASEYFPACALFIEMNPSSVDVNVHPAKLEVKFSDERRVFEAIYYTVKKALEESEYRPELELPQKKSDYNPLGAFVPIGTDTKGSQIDMRSRLGFKSESVKESHDNKNMSGGLSSSPDSKRAEAPVSFGSIGNKSGEEYSPKSSLDLLEKYKKAPSELTAQDQKPINTPEPTPVSSSPYEQSERHEYKLIGEAFDCYIIIEYEGSLLIIDKHAAHERVIFEDLKRSRNGDNRVSSQTLLLPVTVLLTADEAAFAEEYKSEFVSVGFDFSHNGSSVDITAIPEAISPSDAEGLFTKMLSDIIDGVGNPETSENIRQEKALYQVACKAAIKGGRRYDGAITEWLINKVLSLPDITVCPHGRPVAYKLTKNELDRQFDRIK